MDNTPFLEEVERSKQALMQLSQEHPLIAMVDMVIYHLAITSVFVVTDIPKLGEKLVAMKLAYKMKHGRELRVFRKLRKKFVKSLIRGICPVCGIGKIDHVTERSAGPGTGVPGH